MNVRLIKYSHIIVKEFASVGVVTDTATIGGRKA